MDITCPKCKTEYEFEDDKITAEGVTVKCTSCDYTFKVRKKSVVEMEPMDFTSSTKSSESKSWMIRTTSGKVLNFNELTTLQQWIVERRVGRDDQISKSGETWKRLGDIAELASFFQVVEAAIAAESNSPRTAYSPYSPGPATDHAPPSPLPARDEYEEPKELGNLSESQEPAFAMAEGAQFHTVGQSAAWEKGGGRLREHRVTNDYLDEALPRHGSGKLIGLLVVVGVLLGAVVLGVLNKDKLKAMFTSDGDQSNETYQAGRKLFLLDDEESLKQADLQFLKVKPESALVFAARAEVYTTWAQHLRERAEILERRARNMEATPPPSSTEATSPPKEQHEDAKSLRLQALKFKDEADKKLIQAEAYAQKALSLDPERGEVKRAMADYLSLLGRKNQEIMPYIADTFKKLPDDPEAFYVEGSFYVSQGHLARAEKLFNKALIKTKARFGKTLLRAAFQLAFIYLRSGRRDEAKALAQEILEVNSNHQLAKELLVSIGEEEKVAVARTTAIKDDIQPPKEVGGDLDGKDQPKDQPPKDNIPASNAGLSYEALIKKGSQLSERGQTMTAFKLFEKALQMQPSGVGALTGLAYCHLDQEQFAMAITKFKKVLNLSPTNEDALIGMAESYKVQGSNNKALDYYRAYLRTHPGGARSVLAQRNVKELEQKTGVAPEVSPEPVPSPSPAPENTPSLEPPPEPSPPSPESAAPPPSSPSDEAE